MRTHGELAVIGTEASVGPFAYLRPGSSVLTVPTDDIQHLITDSKSEKKQLDALREAGVDVDAV